MNPIVSLVITTYNREKYLLAAIESILVQTYTNFELLIWDDGSSDRSVAMATHYTTFDKRVRVVAAPHTGRGRALKDAIAQTNGKYLGWVDSDDMLAANALAETVSILEAQPSVGMVYTDHLVTDAQGKVKGIGDRCRIPYSKERMLIDFMTFHFRLIRRDVYDALGGVSVDLETAEDYDLCLRLSEVTQIYHHPKPLYLYRTHSDSISESQHLKQILASQKSINNALFRRGLTDSLELEVNFNPRFILKQKIKAHSQETYCNSIALNNCKGEITINETTFEGRSLTNGEKKQEQITAILNVWKRNYLDEQIQSLLDQSKKIESIWILQCQRHTDIQPILDKYRSQNLKYIYSDIDFKYFGRFMLPNSITTEYTLILDDDVIPGRCWVENAIRASIDYKALVGCVGRIVPESALSDPNSCQLKADYMAEI